MWWLYLTIKKLDTQEDLSGWIVCVYWMGLLLLTMPLSSKLSMPPCLYACMSKVTKMGSKKTETKDEKETWCDSYLKMGRWCGGRWMRWCSHLQGLRHERSSLQLTELFHVQQCAAVKSESFNSAAAKVLEAIKSPVLLNTRVENSLSLQHRASTFHFCHRHKWALANGNMASFSSSASERRQKAVFPPQPTYSKSISDAPSLRHQAPSRWKCPFGKGGGGV